MISARVKICGLNTPETVTAAKNAGADFIGFVFYAPSPRNVTAEQATSLAALAPHIPAVAVTVDPSNEMLTAMLAHFTPAYLQLHGHETPERVAEIKETFGIPLIKAISVKNADDIPQALHYEEVADMLMFDAKATGSTLPGGNGVAFDWQLLAGHSFSKPWFLSGGLNPDNVEQAVRISGAKLLDVSSGIESAPGIKSIALIESFIKEAKSVRI